MATAKVFNTGRSQAVRIPKEFRFDVSEVYIYRNLETGNVVLVPKRQGWEDFVALAAATEGRETFLLERDDHPAAERELF